MIICMSDIDPRVEEYRLLIAEVAELVGHSRASSDVLAQNVGQSVARWHLMSVLSGGPHSVAAAARRLGLTRQSVQRVANDLLADGLAISTPDPSDARAPLIELTQLGEQLVTQLYDESEVERTALVERAGLSPQRLRSARSTIRALIDQFETLPKDE